ncbi:beta/gamma crystallin-related protein [Phenylobacterium sp.]|uniref:beta/gamma crystallin-related protein n=1 Tax=Phenylobacterium sp. TaxID=1871053 RepID=UPI002733C992|nr:beta/gamma crystallin-related protein [Phenylobacterium sp.]MDP3659798.1 beta/gamma crystallin-related protein [Phenylobacterium sp.]
MRMILSLAALSLLAAPPVLAQPGVYHPPRGSYERLCSNIQMNGQLMSATCRGARGAGQSTINILSCDSDIGVDAEGGLICAGGPAAPTQPYRPPTQPPVYDRPDPNYGGGPGWNGDYRPGRGGGASLFGGRGWRGPAVRIRGNTPNLDQTGLNDRVRSIQLERGSGPWLICSDADYQGRCTTIRDSVTDTRRLGMGDSISSLRPLR